jgi:hypothetical protein
LASGAAALIVGLVSMTAPPVAAADQTLAIDCLTPGGDLNLSVDPGDVITVNLTNCLLLGTPGTYGQLQFWAATWGSPYDVTGANVFVESTLPGITKVQWTAPDTVSAPALAFSLNSSNLGGGYDGVRTFVYIATGYIPPAADLASPIPAWVQAYGRPDADATCDAGWDPSWQEWAVPATGGWVCTRAIPSLG